MISDRDLAYMAAAIELRGRVSRIDNKMRATTQLRLRVHSRQVAAVERLCTLTGVDVRTEAAKIIDPANRRGCVEHCPEAHVHLGVNIPRVAMWQITGAAAAIVLYHLIDGGYMADTVTIDGEDLELIIDEALLNLPTGQQGRHAVKTSAERLNNLGWRIPTLLQEWLENEPQKVSK